MRSGVHAPGGISVVGYDDSRTAAPSYLDLTSVRQDAEALAQAAIHAAVERLDDQRTTDREQVLTPTLTVRGSTGPPPGES